MKAIALIIFLSGCATITIQQPPAEHISYRGGCSQVYGYSDIYRDYQTTVRIHQNARFC